MRKRRDFDYANYCLEMWAEWAEDNNGFPSRSPTAKYGELRAHKAESSLPTNIEPNSRDVDRAVLVLSMMSEFSGKGKEQSDILKRVNRERCNDETIQETMDRVGIKKSERAYYDALNEFTSKLETLIYLGKEYILLDKQTKPDEKVNVN